MYPYENKALTPVELGASIFVNGTHKNLYRATQLFGFDTFTLEGLRISQGIWDGDKFVHTVCRLLSIQSVTPIKAYGPWIPGNVIGFVEYHIEL